MSHKTAALIAYAEGLLSERGRARVERHLAGCEACARELAAIRLYDKLAAEARAHEPAEPDYAKMELILGREAKRVAGEIRAGRRTRALALGGLALAAAALLAFYVWPRETAPIARHAPPRRVEPAPAPLVEQVDGLSPEVTLAAGTVERIAGGARERVDVGARLGERDRLEVGADGTAHVRLSEGTGLVADASTSIVLARAREEEVRLLLDHGRVSSQVAPLSSGSRYLVLCAGYEVEVRGTRFAVFTLDGGLGVDLTEGVVEVRAPDGSTIELRAPASWRSSGAETAAIEPAAPRAVGAGADEWPVLRLSHADVVRWSVDGTAVGVAGPLAMRVEPGERRVEGWDARGRLYSALVPVGTQDVALPEGELEAEAPRLRPGFLPPEEIQRVVRGSSVSLRQCYERSLRQGPDVEGTLSLRITVGLVGDVQRVQVVGAPAESTAQLQACVVQIAEHWSFPPPGGPVTFQLPVRFSQRRAQ